jgi:chemotaxis protein methyltransferase CheR
MTITESDFQYVRELMLSRSAIVLDKGKEYLVESRLMPLARRHGETDVAGLLGRLRTRIDPHLQTEIIDALTTNETSWFRDRHPYDALANHLLPAAMKARGAEHRLNIWSAACSSGQEPYSIAMTMMDSQPVLASWHNSIVATDLATSMVARTKEAFYTQLEINRGLPATHLVRHFERDGTGWRVRKQLRDMVSVYQHNLVTQPPSFGPYDIVFLRNVLIYFSRDTKRDILSRVRRVMRPEAFLVLGAAETTLNLDDNFDRVEMGNASVYRLKKSQ